MPNAVPLAKSRSLKEKHGDSKARISQAVLAYTDAADVREHVHIT